MPRVGESLRNFFRMLDPTSVYTYYRLSRPWDGQDVLISSRILTMRKHADVVKSRGDLNRPEEQGSTYSYARFPSCCYEIN